MRTQDEIQRAHDILVGLILGEVPPTLVPEDKQKEQLSTMAMVLCWVLRHNHNKAFGELLQTIEECARECGVVVKKIKP